MKPKDIVLKPIAHKDAKRMILKNYRSGSFPSAVKLSLGAFVGETCLGVVVFSIGSRFAHTVIEGGKPGDVWELARLWLDDALPKNSESRVLAVAVKLAQRHAPNARAIITYTDKGVQLYKAAGWEQVPGRYGDTVIRIVDGVEYFSSRAVSSKFGTLKSAQLRQMGHNVVVKPGLHRTKWIHWVGPRGRLALEGAQEAHPLERRVVKLFQQSPKWLGWPGTETLRHALRDGSFAAVYDDTTDDLIGCWVLSRLKTKPVFRDVGCVVDKDHRGRGIGRQLAEKVKAMCDEENRILTFDCKTANPAVAFWRAVGFVETGQRNRGQNAEPYQRFVYLPNRARHSIAPEA